MKWLTYIFRLLFIIVISVILIVSIPFWLEPFLESIGVNSESLQGLDSLIDLLEFVITTVAAFLGTKNTPRNSTESTDSTTLSSTNLNTTNSAFATYKQHIIDRYGYLDFRGMGMTDKIALRLSLLDMYIPLNAYMVHAQGKNNPYDNTLKTDMYIDSEEVSLGSAPLLDLVREQDGLIILGDPGAGKTTFLKYLALHIALDQGKAIGLESYQLPILIPLSAYANELDENDISFFEFIVLFHAKRGLDLTVGALLEKFLEKGIVILLIDGLDEIQSRIQRQDVINRVMDFFTINRQMGNKFILTSRIVGYKEVQVGIVNFRECIVRDFNDEDIQLFVEKWTIAVEQAARGQTLTATQIAQDEKRDLLAAIRHNRGVRHLAANPLLLMVLALMKRQGVNLPERRAELYDKYITILLHEWNLARGLGQTPSYSPNVRHVIKILAPLALWMHEVNPGIGLVREKDMRRELVRIYTAQGIANPHKATDSFLQDVRDHASLLIERGNRQYGFIHLTFQEYLAGVAIARKAQQGPTPMVNALLGRLGNNNWHEVSLLAVGYLGIVQESDEIASAVLLSLANQPTDQLNDALLLAGEALLDVWPDGATHQAFARLSRQLRTLMQDNYANPNHRLQAGLLLADLDIEPMNANEFITSPNWNFAIGRYPVTNKQFRKFVEDNGYSQENIWWEENALLEITNWEGGQWPTSPRFWHNRRLNRNTQPVVGISWYEAQAYCRWLTKQLRRTGIISVKQVARLPTQFEWETAASGTNNLKYVWGHSFDSSKANTKESNFGQTSPVNMYLHGKTTDGIWDLIGNVWEWTIDLHDNRYPWLRGGAFWSDAENCTIDSRYRSAPGIRNIDFGLRVVIANKS